MIVLMTATGGILGPPEVLAILAIATIWVLCYMARKIEFEDDQNPEQ